MARGGSSERFRCELDDVLTGVGPLGARLILQQALERPRVRNARELGFESRLPGRHVARTYALESSISCSFLRGLSVRDVEAAPERPSTSR
jgi:hypothetical protein